MTQDELLEEIDDSTDGLKHEHLFEKLLANTKALRAVVELHKPWYRPGLTKPAPVCAICYTDEGIRVFYPCATIQAIEKELG